MIYETERLILREWRESDLEPFARMGQDVKVMEFFPKLLTHAESAALIARIQAKFSQEGFCFFAVELKSTAEFIGFIGLSIPSFQAHFTPCVEIGWRLAAKYWGYGYASEGAQKCLEIGFKQLKLREIVSFAVKDNLNSIKVMQKIGMQQDLNGSFMHPSLAEDSPLAEHVLYRIQAPQE